jgi:hypothetical protein
MVRGICNLKKTQFGLHGHPRLSIDINNKSTWISNDLYGCPWISMDHGHPWIAMDAATFFGCTQEHPRATAR